MGIECAEGLEKESMKLFIGVRRAEPDVKINSTCVQKMAGNQI